MILEGDESVLSVIKDQKKALDAGTGLPDVNLLCIVDGGLMKGAYATGAGLALEELGYTNVFNTVVGVSSGAPSAAYFVAKEVYKGSSLIYEECCSRAFWNPYRFWSPVDPTFIIRAMQEGRKKIDTTAILRSNSKLLIGVAEYETGLPKLLSIENEEDLFLAIEASISIPTLTSNRVMIDNTRYTDGGFASPHILAHTLNTIPATHVLVFTNQDKSTADIPQFEKLLNATLLRHRYSPALRGAANIRRRARHELVSKILREPSGTKVCFVWGDGSLPSTERSAQKVRSVVERSREFWLNILR